jgi:dihydroxy-acid dehydratase
VKNGDMIRLDVPARRIELLVEAAELERRAAEPRPAQAVPRRGYARLFHESVTQADQGCDFDFLIGTDEGEDPTGR